jgi:hypothetical protein
VPPEIRINQKDLTDYGTFAYDSQNSMMTKEAEIYAENTEEIE